MATDYGKQYDELNWQNYINNINNVNTTADKQKQVINDNYIAQIKEAETAYDDQQRVNAVQKLINERQVAESMANNGLTNSGLNRTQQTAVQLSYANNKAELDRQRQSAVDALNREMNSYLTDIETNRLSSVSSLESNYNAAKTSYISEREQADAANAATIEAARIKAEQEAAARISRIGYGTLASMSYGSNGNVIYTDTSGNSVTMRAGANPYTGEVNSDLLTDGVYDATRAFSNGYQPKYIGNKELKEVKDAEYSPSWRTDGKTQKVFSTDGGKTCYVWNGPENRYEQVVKVNGTSWYLKDSIPDKSSFAKWKLNDFTAYLSSVDKSERQSEYDMLCYIGAIPSSMKRQIYLTVITG